MEVHPFTMNCLACLYECTGKAFALNPASAFGGGGHSVGVSKMLSILLSIFIPRQKGLGDTAMSIASVRRLSLSFHFCVGYVSYNTVRNILMILHSYVKQVMTMRALTFIL